MKRYLGWAAFAAALTASALTAAPASADELTDVYAQILRDPANSALNLRYAALAEMKGDYRLALAAYERVLLNDPNNEDAKRGLSRMLILLQPPTTRITVNFGTGYESNPANAPSHETGRAIAFGSIAIRDDRKWGMTPWRTDFLALGNVVVADSTLNYGYMGITTGPVWELATDWSAHVGGGVAGAVFDRRPYYVEGTGVVTVDGKFGGERQSITLRGGWREYDRFFTATNGGYIYLSDQIAVPITAGGLMVVTPFAQYSAINGAFFPATPVTEVQPGRYFEYGGDIGFYQEVETDVIVGADILARHRQYHDRLASTAHSRENYLAPGADVTFKNVFMGQTDLRLDYRYRKNDSNDPLRDYIDHVVTVSVSKRF